MHQSRSGIRHEQMPLVARWEFGSENNDGWNWRTLGADGRIVDSCSHPFLNYEKCVFSAMHHGFNTFNDRWSIKRDGHVKYFARGTPPMVVFREGRVQIPGGAALPKRPAKSKVAVKG